MATDYQALAPTERQRRPELTRGDDFIKAMLRRGVVAHVGNLSGDQPFVHPTNYWYDEPGHRLVFHGHLAGRTRSNLEHFPRACAEVSEFGRLLPSNSPYELSIQYRAVLVFGRVAVISEPAQARAALTGLIARYFPALREGQDYRPITPQELGATSVYALAIESWSGKENWPEAAEQLADWTPLAATSSGTG
jgi:nitroimidazol reductase NimA-like FMN-containing flavoprotein (pyridoxamine 5'-phosphate oxidase superfamily)